METTRSKGPPDREDKPLRRAPSLEGNYLVAFRFPSSRKADAVDVLRRHSLEAYVGESVVTQEDLLFVSGKTTEAIESVSEQNGWERAFSAIPLRRFVAKERFEEALDRAEASSNEKRKLLAEQEVLVRDQLELHHKLEAVKSEKSEQETMISDQLRPQLERMQEELRKERIRSGSLQKALDLEKSMREGDQVKLFNLMREHEDAAVNARHFVENLEFEARGHRNRMDDSSTTCYADAVVYLLERVSQLETELKVSMKKSSDWETRCIAAHTALTHAYSRRSDDTALQRRIYELQCKLQDAESELEIRKSAHVPSGLRSPKQTRDTSPQPSKK